MARIVVALGGNALGKTPEEQIEAVRHTAEPIVDLIEDGNEIVLAHGNGAQVGLINLAFETANGVPEMPFPECGAMSQGYIGYHLQNALREELIKRKIDKPVSTIITQVIVDKKDPAFKHPSKPVGSFYSAETAKRLTQEKGYTMVEDAGRGYRRVVPSPLPLNIVEKEVIKTLVAEGQLVIACGGGGIPVIEDGKRLTGIPAVIDKDFASEKLAELTGADFFVILTAVEKVVLNFGQENETPLDTLDARTARKYIEEGHFAPGSMLPKVEAAVKFAVSKPDRKTLITSLVKAKEGLAGKTGTTITG